MRQTITILSLFLCVLTVVAHNMTPPPMPDVNLVIDNTPDSLGKARTARPVAGSTRHGNNPVLFLVGNSTMRTGTLGNGDNGQWGWGYFLPEYFDANKITVENHALGGMSSRTFYTRLWPDVLKGVRPGDWVIIELGHNDNGPYDSGRARASIRGIGKDSIEVTIKETGKTETVYSYGEYLRRYVDDVRRKGANPILMSLTPRCAWDDDDSTKVSRVDKTFGLWAKQIADEKQIPFVDLNEITARKFERYGNHKVKTMFYLDRIHTSEFGARANAESAIEGLKMLSGVPLKNMMTPESPDTVTGHSRRHGQPVIFTIGDSTVKNEDSGDDSMWGWGSVIHELFDTTFVSVENHAFPGRSARTFLDEGRWDRIYSALQPGDFVLIQFGHNDGGDINVGKARGELHGAGSESKVFKMEATGTNKVIYTFGWYLRKFIMDAKEKGAVPIILSHTPRNRWHNGKIESNRNDYGLWARQAALQEGAFFVDLNEISGRKLQALGEENSARFFKNDHTHTSKAGARLNARSIAQGLSTTDCPLKEYLLPLNNYGFKIKEVGTYNEFDGFGFDFNTSPSNDKNKPYFFSVRVPDGNYEMTLGLGDKNREGRTTVRTENRRLMLDDVTTRKGETTVRSFIVSKREPTISLTDTVKINSREKDTPEWDGKLTLEITGEAPAVRSIDIRPVSETDSITTIFLCGNSTVVDQKDEPWASWGQIIPAYFDDKISISNHAESGESTTSFIQSKRLDKVLAMAKPGDWIFMEFGHNDEKDCTDGSGAWYNFTTNLKIFVDRARKAGLNPVLITPTARRYFNEKGKLTNTHGEYPDAVKAVARREGIPVIDLTVMSTILFETLGVDGSKKAFVHYPAGCFPGQTTELAVNTHFNPYGATQIAKCVVSELKKIAPQLARHITLKEDYSPLKPDNPDSFIWPQAPGFDIEKPYGN